MPPQTPTKQERKDDFETVLAAANDIARFHFNLEMKGSSLDCPEVVIKPRATGDYRSVLWLMVAIGSNFGPAAELAAEVRSKKMPGLAYRAGKKPIFNTLFPGEIRHGGVKEYMNIISSTDSRLKRIADWLAGDHSEFRETDLRPELFGECREVIHSEADESGRAYYEEECREPTHFFADRCPDHEGRHLDDPYTGKELAEAAEYLKDF